MRVRARCITVALSMMVGSGMRRKYEIRMTNSERNPNVECPNPAWACSDSSFGIWVSEFGFSQEAAQMSAPGVVRLPSYITKACDHYFPSQPRWIALKEKIEINGLPIGGPSAIW